MGKVQLAPGRQRCFGFSRCFFLDQALPTWGFLSRKNTSKPPKSHHEQTCFLFNFPVQNSRPFYPKFYFSKPQEINLTSLQEAIETVLEDHNDEWPLDIHWIRFSH